MPIEYPYVVTLEKFKEFYGGLHQKGIPSKADNNWLRSIGYASSNHRAFIPALRFIGLIDASGSPTDDYKPVVRGANRARLATLIRTAYAPLFGVLPDAHRKDKEALRAFFRANTSGGDQVVSAMASTFQVLCSFADFDAEPAAVSSEAAQVIEEAQQSQEVTTGRGVARREAATGGLTLNINLQIELPATTDAEVYEKLFAAMAKHLMKLGEE